MTLNQFGVTAEANDRLLELMGGCRHEITTMPFSSICTCSKCESQWTAWDVREMKLIPAVGDGHDFTLARW